MQTDRVRRGFTLIELLTVIAIIGILAGLTAAGLSRAIFSARMTELHNRMGNVADLLYVYYTENGQFPPAYGYVFTDIRDERRDCGPNGVPDADPLNDATPREDPVLCLNPEDTNAGTPDEFRPYNQFFLGSYMDLLGQGNNKDLYDSWSESYDTDGDGRISYFEYLPLDDAEPNDTATLYEDGTLRAQTAAEEAAEAALLRADQRPFIYIPVNRRQAERVGQWYLNNLAGANPIPNEADNPPPGDPNTHVNPRLHDELANALANQAQSELPPAKYDAFVLMSVGPQNNTGGLLSQLTNMVDISANYPDNYKYHILAHVLFYLATRDADNNGLLDFNYDDRRDLPGGDTLYALPDPLFQNAPGPVILVSSD